MLPETYEEFQAGMRTWVQDGHLRCSDPETDQLLQLMGTDQIGLGEFHERWEALCRARRLQADEPQVGEHAHEPRRS